MKSEQEGEGEQRKLLDADNEISFLSKGSSHSSISYVDDPHWSHWVNHDSFHDRHPEHAVGHHHVIEDQGHEAIGSHEHGDVWDVDGYIGEPRLKGLDRFTTMFHILGFWGDSFSDKFVSDIDQEGKTKQYNKTKQVSIGPDNDVITCYPKGSTELRVHEEVHGFVSYRWQTGRTNLHMAFISTFAMPIVYGVCILFYPIVVTIITFAVDKNVVFNETDSKQHILPLGVAMILHLYDGVSTERAFAWFWFKIVGVAILIPLLLAGAQLFFFKRKFWVDRFCVNQTDSQLMWLSIRRLPLYLSSSQNLYSFFDDKYISRLWCALELALYCAVRPNPKITFISVSQEKAGVLCFLVIFTLGVAAASIKYCMLADGIRHNDPNDGNDSWSPSRSWRIALYVIGFVSQLLARGIVYYCGRSLYHALDLLAQTEQDFDVRNCGLGSENDRDTLLALIHELYITFPQAANMEVGVSNRAMNTSNSQLQSTLPDAPEQQILEDAPDGLETFNRFIRKNLRQHIPWSGLRSCVVLTYLPAFLLSSVNFNFHSGLMTSWSDANWFNLMDNVAGGSNFKSFHMLRFGNIFARCWGAFVSGPFDVFILGCYVKLLWIIEKKFNVHWSVLYVVLFVFDIFLPLRRWFVDTFTHELLYNMISRNEFEIYASPFFYQPELLYYPWRGYPLFDGCFGLNILSGGKKMTLVVVELHPGWCVLITIWIIAVTAFTYYIYEPAFLRQYRSKGWSWICSIGKKKLQ